MKEKHSRNGVTNNLSNGVQCENKEDSMCKGDSKDIPRVDEVPYEVNHPCGDYIKNGKVFLSRRTANAAFGAKVDFDSIIKQ